MSQDKVISGDHQKKKTTTNTDTGYIGYNGGNGISNNTTAGTATYGNVNYTPVEAFNPVALDPYQRTSNYWSAQDMAKNLGIDYNYDNILKMYMDAVNAENAYKMKEYGVTENKFYNRLSDTQYSALDTIRKSLAPAMATGASSGMQANNVLSAVLGLQQTSMEDSTQLANDRNLLIDELAKKRAEAPLDARKYYDDLANKLGTLINGKYESDVMYDTANMDYLATGNQTLNDTLARIFDIQSRSNDNKYTADTTSRDNKYNVDQNRLNNIMNNNTNLAIANMNNETQRLYNNGYLASLAEQNRINADTLAWNKEQTIKQEQNNNQVDFSTAVSQSILNKDFDSYVALMASNTNMSYSNIQKRWKELMEAAERDVVNKAKDEANAHINETLLDILTKYGTTE